jgi:hypothetical protein
MCRLLYDRHIFYVPFSEKLDSLLDRLDNEHMMVLKIAYSSRCARIKRMPITVAV